MADLHESQREPDTREKESARVVFLAFLKLGITAFGGPIAHLSYFRDEFVTRRKWISEQGYADLISLCQFLPGPASSQVGMALGFLRAGTPGALAAWCAFTLPSAVALIFFASGFGQEETWLSSGGLKGLKIVAVAVIAHALMGMAKAHCRGAGQVSCMILATALAYFVPTSWMQIIIIASSAIVGRFLFRLEPARDGNALSFPMSQKRGLQCLALLAFALFALPIAARAGSSEWIVAVDAFFRAGALVFGGGHVVLPLLKVELVPTGLIAHETFLAGYAVAQAIPGPLFSFSAFLGASIPFGAPQWLGGLVCLVSIFVPSFLLVAGVLPFWERIRKSTPMRNALAGVNAAVVGLLLATFCDPVWTSAIRSVLDFSIAALAFLAITFWRVPPWTVVLGTALLGWAWL